MSSRPGDDFGAASRSYGSGRPLFADVVKPHSLELVSSLAFADGVVSLVYRRPR